MLFSQRNWSCGRVARQSSAKASTAVRIRSGPPFERITQTVILFLIMKYSQAIGILAALALIGSCFLPWIEVASLHQTLNGLHGEVNANLTFGHQWIPHSFFAVLSIICFWISTIGAKRTNIFIGCINLGWAFKNYILFSMCRQGECPEVKIGLILMVIFSIIIQVMTFLPNIKVKQSAE